MNSRERVFRERALDNLSSPEQLDQLMQVTPAHGWLLALAASLLVMAAFSWAVFGRMTTTVKGTGLLVQGGGVTEVVAIGDGQLVSLYVNVGDRIEKGQVVARIAVPALRERLEVQHRRVEELRAKNERIHALALAAGTKRKSLTAQQHKTLHEAIDSDHRRIVSLQAMLLDQEALFQQGLLTRAQLHATQQQIDAAYASSRNDLVALQSTTVEGEREAGNAERELMQSELTLNEAIREHEALEQRIENASRITATATGRVAEVRARVGDVVGTGRTILALKPELAQGTELRAVVFVPLQTGKVLAPGMIAHLVPASVRREEYGLLQGIVTTVIDVPSSQYGIQNLLENELLTRSVIERVGAAPIAVEVELVPHPATRSGYLWTTKDGPPLLLTGGTPCEVTIAVRSQRPIERLFPMLRKVAGL